MCTAGEVIGASGIALPWGVAGATATCGGASASCAGWDDCVDASQVALYDDVGVCAPTSETAEYADCFALPAPVASSCAVELDYDACAFTCDEVSFLRTRAATTAESGFPRVLSRCGGAQGDCQAFMGCETLVEGAGAGVGVCLSRTVSTVASCQAFAAPESAPARCGAVGEHCFISCEAGDVVAASAFQVGGADPGAVALCGSALASCIGFEDCLGVGDAPSERRAVGLCLASGPDVVADCFALAPPQSATCVVATDYGACAFVCQAGAALDLGAAGRPDLMAPGPAYPRSIATCPGGSSVTCQFIAACAASTLEWSSGAGVCLGRTERTTTVCATTYV